MTVAQLEAMDAATEKARRIRLESAMQDLLDIVEDGREIPDNRVMYEGETVDGMIDTIYHALGEDN